MTCYDALKSTHAKSCHFFFNDTATSEIYTLSLHDALPIYKDVGSGDMSKAPQQLDELAKSGSKAVRASALRSEEHTSELQSRRDLVCRLLLEKKKELKIVWHYQSVRPQYHTYDLL